MRKFPLLTCILFALAVLGPAPLAADPVTNAFKVSVKASGLTEGKKYPFMFRLYNAAVGGELLFEEPKSYTVPASKVITHTLGSVNLVQPLLAEDFLQQLWVEASVPNKTPFPRVMLGVVPLAIGSQNADLLDGLDSSAFALFDHLHESGPATDADTLDGQHGAYYLNAGNLTGTVADARLSTNVALLGGAQTVTGTKTFNPPGSVAPFAVGATNTVAVTNLNADLLDGLHGSDYRNASNLNAGTVGTDRYSAYGDLGAEGYLGNAAGDVALNNGALQATLYAQRAQSADGLAAAALSSLDLRYGSAPLLPALGGFTVATVDTSPATGADSSIGVTIGADGLPVIVYADLVADAIKVLHCDDDACSSGTVNTVYLTGAGGAIGIDAAITIGTNGFPVVAFFDDVGADLFVAVCDDPACASSSLVIPDFTGAVGMDPSITIGTDGFPVISYYDLTNTNLKIFHCTNANCSSGSATSPDGASASVGAASSIAIGAGGYPVVSYYDSTNGDLEVLLCGNAACTSGNSMVTADSTGTVGSFTSVTIGADGLPVVSYYDPGTLDLKVFHCGNAACSSGNTATTVDSTGDVGRFSSITIGAGGLPVVSYQDTTNLNLKVLNCGNTACTSGNTVTTLDSSGSVGWNTSITSGADGQPVIAFWDYTNGDLKLARRFIKPLGRR